MMCYCQCYDLSVDKFSCVCDYSLYVRVCVSVCVCVCVCVSVCVCVCVCEFVGLYIFQAEVHRYCPNLFISQCSAEYSSLVSASGCRSVYIGRH